jgi:glycosyltransferase involved in cell wall biosynthesis
MVNQPLVSVICLCFNQQRFVREAVESVLCQTYSPIQLIVVDDASTDSSKVEIKNLKEEYPSIELMLLDTNLGNCQAFNKALSLVKGEYIIDLAADDVLLPTRIEKGVKALQNAGAGFGVTFSDAELIDERGKMLYIHSDRFPHQTIPQGNVYKDIIQQYFICPPTIMATRKIMDALKGYDETLTYEDFDFWIRSSRQTQYTYVPEVLVKKRVIRGAMSENQFKLFSRHSASTFRVCEKILKLNQSEEEKQALAMRIRYELLLNLRLLNFTIATKFGLLRIKNQRQRYPL